MIAISLAKCVEINKKAVSSNILAKMWKTHSNKTAEDDISTIFKVMNRPYKLNKYENPPKKQSLGEVFYRNYSNILFAPTRNWE